MIIILSFLYFIKSVFFMLWCWFSSLNSLQKAPSKGAVPAYFFFDYANLSQITSKKVHFLHHCIKLVQIKCRKFAGTKMHKCLVELDLFKYKTRTKVVHKNVSHGCNKSRKSKMMKITDPLHNKQVILCDLKSHTSF